MLSNGYGMNILSAILNKGACARAAGICKRALCVWVGVCVKAVMSWVCRKNIMFLPRAPHTSHS